MHTLNTNTHIYMFLMWTFISVNVGSLDFQSSCVRRPKFIVCTGGNPSGYIPTHTSQNSSRYILNTVGFTPNHTDCTRYILIYIFKSILSWASGLLSGNIWRNLSSLMPQREVSTQVCMSSCLLSTFGGLPNNHVHILLCDCPFCFAQYVNKCNCIVLQYSLMASVCGPCMSDPVIIETNQCIQSSIY